MRRSRNELGFTIVELMVICPILMAVIAFMMSYLFRQFGELTKNSTQVNLQVTAQAAIFNLQDDVFFANAFVSDLNTGLTDSYAPSGGWVASSNPLKFIISTPAETGSHRSASRSAVYINTLGCSPQSTKELNDPLYENIIIFTSGTNLYKRIVTAPSTMATCGTSFRKQTCPAANASPSCPADILLTDRLSSMTVTYKNSSGTVVTTPEQASLVAINLTLTDTAFAEPVSATSTITLRRLNQ
ncbi:MAG: hypothetical protein JWO41_285 [Candidatus Saccharibacteria bacterium]|nr:hypothetical protein [Candidatus Saccharibacteria bacterium]